MTSQKLNPIVVDRAIHKVLDSLKDGLTADYIESSGELVALLRVRNRKHWWEFWKPKYRWPDLESKIDFIVDPKASIPAPLHGRVVKATARPEYTPDAKRTGGRVVRAMPQEIKRIKEGQEAPNERQ
jgi:hypothetical protein